MRDGWMVRVSREGDLEILWKGARVARAPKPLDFVSGRSAASYHALRWRGARLESSCGNAEGVRLAMTASFKPVSGSLIPTLVEEREVRFLTDAPDAMLAVRYDLLPDEDPEEGFLVIPALWYGDNEAWNDKIAYPKGLQRDWSFKADGSSAPAVVLSLRKNAYAVGLDATLGLKTPHPGLDDVWGIGFEAALQSPRAFFTFPAQEVPQSYPWGHQLRKPKTPRADFKKGTVLRFRVYHHAGTADRAFHAAVWRQRLSMTRRVLRYDFPSSRLDRTAALFTRCLKESHFLEGRGFSHRDDIKEIFSGWCGGFAAAYAAIRWGDVSHDGEFRAMGETMADYLCSQGVSPSGFFYSENALGRWVQRTFWAKGRGIPMRNPSEGSCYLSLMLRYERSLGRRRSLWDAALRSNLDAVLRSLRSDGALPQEVDGRTGEPLSWTGTTPAAWAGALAVYSALDEDRARGRRYLSAALKIGGYYAKHYVARERYIGGPYDTFMAPNMEDPYNLLLAYMELHRTTGEDRWLAVARKVADHLLSWRYTHDVRFPDGTWCRQQKVKTFAMSPASVSNKHVQNWDTLADPYLILLSRWTGDPLYAEQASQHLKASTQLVQHGQLPQRIPYGGQSEQWYATDFNWFGDSGPYSKGNVWQVSVCLPKAGFLISLAELKKPLILK